MALIQLGRHRPPPSTLDVTGVEAFALSESTLITVAGAHASQPTDVTWATMVEADLSSDTLDLAYGVGTVKHGMTYGTGAGSMFTRSLADQDSWRDSDCDPIPVCPNGRDRVQQCRINLAAMATSSEKGHAGFTPGSGVKSMYLEWYGLITSNWFGEASGSFKKFYIRTFNAPSVGKLTALLYNGAGSQATRFGVNYETVTPAPHKAAFSTFTRNTWALISVVVAAESSAGASDGHVTWFKNDVQVHQQTGIDWGDTDFRVQQSWLNYLGGNAPPTVPPAGFVAMSTLTSDGFYFAKSLQRCAVP